MHCKVCGKEIDSSAQFCPYCGSAVDMTVRATTEGVADTDETSAATTSAATTSAATAPASAAPASAAPAKGRKLLLVGGLGLAILAFIGFVLSFTGGLYSFFNPFAGQILSEVWNETQLGYDAFFVLINTTSTFAAITLIAAGVVSAALANKPRFNIFLMLVGILFSFFLFVHLASRLLISAVNEVFTLIILMGWLLTLAMLVCAILIIVGAAKNRSSLKSHKIETARQAAVSGYPLQNIANPDDAPSLGFAILGFIFPLIGLILFLVWREQYPLKARSCGKGALIGFITSLVLSCLGGIATALIFAMLS